MKHIGTFNTHKVDGSVTYTQTEIYQGELADGEMNETEVFIKTIETGYHNGGDTIRKTEKWYPISVLSAFTGNYNQATGKPEIDMEILATILLQFGITLN